ncbi:MAG: cysteine desulfurase NifS [Candidatus Fimivicinus sp.]|nr:cysteine desulfurase NifS [Candidatus Fimivicinus sp.]
MKDSIKRYVYADNAATTAVSPQVVEAMLPFLTEHYGNPSSLYSLGQTAHNAVEAARGQVAALLGAQPEEIFFTSGGSEADNWAIRGIAGMQARKGKRHIVTTKFEHHAVLHTVERLQKEGFEVTYLDVHENGIVRIEEVEAALRDDTALVTIMYANNEIGTIQPIAEIGALCRARGILFHTDAVQAVGHVPIDVQAQQIDLLSLSGHKLHAPKGVGALYCRKGLRFPNLIDGGAQERNRRAGTENVAGIVALGKAASLMQEGMEERMRYVASLRDRLIDGALTIKRSRLNGDRESRLPGNASFCFEGVEGESLLLLLDFQGISASSGSACTSGSLDPSHVLLAIGLPHEIAHGSLRLTLDENNTVEDVDYILEKLPPIIERLRDMSPLWERIQSKETE